MTTRNTHGEDRPIIQDHTMQISDNVPDYHQNLIIRSLPKYFIHIRAGFSKLSCSQTNVTENITFSLEKIVNPVHLLLNSLSLTGPELLAQHFKRAILWLKLELQCQSWNLQ